MNSLVKFPNHFEALDRFFDETWDALMSDTYRTVVRSAAKTPAMDVIENDKEIRLVLDLPGITPESVSIEVDKGVLTLKTPVREAEETTYLRRERFHGAYERSVRLPDTIQEDAVNAYFENGVLTLVLPKKPEAQPIRIPVTTSNSR